MSIGKRIYAELRGDRAIWMIVAMLALFSLMAVYSATGSAAFKVRGGDTESYLFRHGIILLGGLFITYLAYLTHYMKYNKMAPWLMLVTIPLLVYTIASGAGEVNEARRWIEIPFIGLTFQTSDLAKLALILFVGREITKHKEYIDDLQKAFTPIIVPIIIICGLIAPADLSTSLLLFVTTMGMMFIGRVNMKYIGLLFLLGVVVFALLIILAQFFPDIIRMETWVNRMRDFNDGTGGYQVDLSKMAIASGEYFGNGPGNSLMRNYLPAPYSDFIYATIMEEYGLVGGFVLLGLYVMLFFRAVALVTKSDKSFGALTAMGLTMLLVIQALANMAVAVNLVPVTGLTLPLVSMGGTSILFTCIAFGIILSISKYVERGAAAQEAADSALAGLDD